MSLRRPWDRAKDEVDDVEDMDDVREPAPEGDDDQDRRIAALGNRVADLEAEVSEMRRHHLRLAELSDLVQELLVPMSGRDEARIREAIDHFNASI